MGNINKPALSLENQAWLEQIYDKLVVKMRAECARIGTMIPYSTCNGEYHNLDMSGGIHFWMNGFWTGVLWQMYGATGDGTYREAAEGTEERLAEILVDLSNSDHDIGFLLLPSPVANYRKTGNQEARIRGLKTAQILAGRYNPAGQFIRAWNDNEMIEKMMGEAVSISGRMIIDCIISIPLLYQASKEAGAPRFTGIALNHARTAQQYVVRADGSYNHIVAFDPGTGEFLDNPGGQGFEQGSSWGRGQSWAAYGFSLSYRHTRDVSFLDTVKKCAHYCISNTAITGWLPLVNYRAPLEPIRYDTTVGMVAACELLELTEHVGEYEGRLYVEVALRMLRACDARFVSWNPNEDSIIGGGTFLYHDPGGGDTEVPTTYGDYYFIEAILRLKGKSLFLW